MQLDDRTLTLACFYYGVIVVVIGVVSFVVPRKVKDLRLKDSLWLLGVFGLLHGLRAFLQVAELIAPATVTERTLFLLDFISIGLNVMALLCLAQFTAELMALAQRGLAWLRWMPLAGLAAWLALTIVPTWLQGGGHIFLSVF